VVEIIEIEEAIEYGEIALFKTLLKSYKETCRSRPRYVSSLVRFVDAAVKNNQPAAIRELAKEGVDFNTLRYHLEDPLS
jgi:hypothetical protein